MGWCSLILVSVVLMHHGTLKPTPPNHLTKNLNLNDAPNEGPILGSPGIESEEWKTGKTSAKDSTCPKKRHKRDDLKMDKKRARILGGFTYNPKRWIVGDPEWEYWTASIKIKTYDRTPSGKFKKDRCSGVLISKRHILTALHCLADIYNSDREKSKLLFPLKNVAIFFDVNNAKIWSGTQFNSAAFFHMNMKAGRILYYKNTREIIDDIAVIKLDREVTWEEDCLRPIKITNQPLKRDHSGAIVLPGQYWIAGWGAYSFVPGQNPYPDFLQYTNQLATTPCPTGFFEFMKNHICFERTNHYATCFGDSGSPGVIKKVDDAGDIWWYLQGIHSSGAAALGYKTSHCNETRSIGIDVNVFKYKEKIEDWIRPYTLS